MRPTKLKPHLITALREVVADEANMLVCTDEEIFFLMNDCLDWDDRISYRTFKSYKQKALAYFSGEEELPQDVDPMYGEFYAIIRRATLNMKRNLMRNMMEADKNDWMRYKWVMERKFPDFRMEKAAPPVEEPLPVPQFRISTPPMPNWMATAIAEEEIRAEKERQQQMIAAEKERLLGQEAATTPPNPSNGQLPPPPLKGALNTEAQQPPLGGQGGEGRQEPAKAQAEVPWQEMDKNAKAPNGIPLSLIQQKAAEEEARNAYWRDPNRPRTTGKIYGFY